MRREMRPLKLRETLVESIAIYRQAFLQLFLMSALLMAVGRLVSEAVIDIMTNRGSVDLSARIVGNLVSVPFTGLIPAFIADHIQRVYTEDAPSMRDTYTAVLARAGGIIAVVIIASVPSALISAATSLTSSTGRAMLLPSFLVLVLAFIVFLALAFAIPVYVIESTTVLNAIKRSWQLTRGYRGRILGYYVVASLPTMIAAVILSALMRSISASPSTTAIVTGLSAAAFTPFVHGVMTLLYFTVRIEKEPTDSDSSDDD